jgi:hypothetical protein
MATTTFSRQLLHAVRLLLAVVLVASGLVLTSTATPAHAATNKIVTENALTGNPASQWDVQGAGDVTLQGFTTQLSVAPGENVDFKVDDKSATGTTNPAAYRIDIYRLGYYGGAGARLVATIDPAAITQPVQPACILTDPLGARLLDCGNWAVTASWQVPAGAVSGIYIARPTRTADATQASHIAFVVRDDTGGSDILVQTSDTTWQAYNPYGGYNAYYTANGVDGNAWKLSYNRPFTTRGGELENWLFNSEYPMLLWLERNGYDVSYTTHIDTGLHPERLLGHKTFMSSGHDEYWSQAQRDSVENARDHGVNLAFFSGNEMYWRIRYEDSTSGTTGDQRTMVVYKEGSLAPSQESEHRRCYLNFSCDPVDWTGLWRETTTDGLTSAIGSPENAVTGQISWRNNTSSITVPSDYASLRFWRNTPVANLTGTDSVTLGSGTLGYEWSPQYEQFMAWYPAGRVLLSSTNALSTFAGVDQHHLSLYRAPSGAIVFGAGTVQWAWGLDNHHDRTSTQANSSPDPTMQQATVNLLADMGAQPATLQTGLLPSDRSTDTTPPTVTITSPADSASVPAGPVTVTGTASDTGGAVGVVEVSTDGQVWRPATGGASWSFTFIATPGTTTIQVRAADDSANLGVEAARTVTVTARTCTQSGPCSIFTDTPVHLQDQDGSSNELGVKFRSRTAGYITGIRFFQTPGNTGTHTGSLWAADGTNLATAMFTGESGSGWQSVTFGAPVPITADTTYVASYHAPNGHYAVGTAFTYASVDSPPLTALQGDYGSNGHNGVYSQVSSTAFPSDSTGSSNYLVDVLFSTTVGPDTIAPTVACTVPVADAAAVGTTSNVIVTFSEALDPQTISGATVFLKTSQGTVVPATLTYSNAARSVTLDPTATLDNHALYTVTVVSGAGGVKDVAGNPLASDDVWSFTTAFAQSPRPDPNAGPGGPVLVATGTGTYGSYLKEILRAEGLNLFAAGTTADLTTAGLAPYTTVVLGETTLTADQVTALSAWVTAGGNLVAVRPDARLAGLLGLSAPTGTLAEGYIKVDTSTAPGEGIVSATMQFHGTADLYTAQAGTQVVAELYSTASTATGRPAVTLRSVGTAGGSAAAFTYDLAGSVVKTRQGNPAWMNQNRDGQAGPNRSDDLYYGNAVYDPQPDYVDMTKVDIPQADEQQRLLANVMTVSTRDALPLPRFWYLPRGEQAAIVMTADNHDTGSSATAATRLNQELAASPAGCAVDDWTCIRSTTYLYSSNFLTNAQAKAYEDQGFEIALHTNTGCSSPTADQYAGELSTQLGDLASKYPSLQPTATIRNHCISWSDYTTMPQQQAQVGINLDTDYYYWPGSWVADRPGLFTGSGFAQRFSTTDGQLVDVYQGTTQMTDESLQTYPATATALMDAAITKGYYGTFVANIHSDGSSETINAQIVAEAKARSIPVISAKQLLTWTDGRNESSFGSLARSGNSVTFSIAKDAGANGLEAMLPVQGGTTTLQALTRDGTPVSTQLRTVKGVAYKVFTAVSGSYTATYGADTTGPVISNVNVAAGANGTATITWTTDEPSTSRVDFGTAADQLTSRVDNPTLATSHSASIPRLADTFYYRLSSADAYGNTTTSAPTSFTMPLPVATDDTVSDFTAGTTGAGTYVSNTSGGEVILTPSMATEFDGTALPSGWTSTLWGSTGGTTVSGGQAMVDGALLRTTATYGSGRSLEFVATFSGTSMEHGGFADFSGNQWAIFSTRSGGSLWARVATDTLSKDVDLGATYFGSPHRYRVDWLADSVVFSVDGTVVATTTATITAQLPVAASDLSAGGTSVNVDWMRLTPYGQSGSFLSRIQDAGARADWGTFSWNSATPTGTGLTLSVRTGDTAVPDGTWTAFTAIQNGGDVTTRGRYLQYRADLASTDASLTPQLASVTVAYSVLADQTVPVITGRTPAPGATDVAMGTGVTITFNESVDPSSVTAASVRLYAAGSPDISATRTVNGATVTLTPGAPLTASTVFTVNVSTTVTDLAGNPLAAPDSWTFTTTSGTFTNTPPPTIAGSTVVGQTLTATLPPWTPATTSITWQWLADNAAITGATTSTFVLTAAQLGKVITVAATGQAPGLTPQTRTSAPTAAVIAPLVVAGTVTVSGSVTVGGVLTANPGTWAPAPLTLSYQWLRDGTTAITGATGTTYSPVTADQGHTLVVSVTGTKTGYTSATARSTATIPVGAAPGTYRSLSPARLLDTRVNGPKVGWGQARTLQVTGAGGVPSSGVSAVVLNVTVTETTASGYLTVSPTGTARPVVSNLNWTAGTTIPNAVTVKVGTGGQIDLFQSGPGSAQVIVDVGGYYVDGDVSVAGGYRSLAPARMLDTRAPTGGGALGDGEIRDLQILGAQGVQTTNVSAVVLNVTVTDTAASGYLTLFPSGTTRPLASNLNWAAGTTIPNLVTVKVGGNGKVSIYKFGPSTAQVIVDVAGFFLGGTPTEAGTFVSLAPVRVLDTRNTGRMGPGAVQSLSPLQKAGVPAGASAVVMNTTVTDTTAPGFLTVFPGTNPLPATSDLNWSGPGLTIPKLVTVQLGTDGSLKLYNASAGSTQVVADLAGYYRT